MLGIPFVRLHARAALQHASAAVLVAILGSACAATSKSVVSESSRLDYERSAVSAVQPPTGGLRDTTAALNAPVLDRSAYIRAVLAQNPTLESARQSWRAALGRARQSGVIEDPMIDLGLAPLSIGSTKAPLGYQLGISQRLPWFGKRSLEASAAGAEADASRSDYETTRRDLALSALLLYDQYFVAARSLEVNQHHVELMRVMQDAATAQFQSGRGAAQDALQAEAELAHMEHDAAILASQRDVTVAQMNELLHRAPELPLPPPPKELPTSVIPRANESERLERDALVRRTEIAAARQHARAAQARADRADREYYPDVTVSTSYNSMWDTPEHRWMVGLGFSLPIQTERRAGAADEALAMRAQLESEASRLSDAARTQVYVALQRLRESEHVLGLFEKRLLPVARDRIAAAQAGFMTSQNSFLTLVEAEKNLRSIELEYQLARVDGDRHSAELDHALGRIPGLADLGAKP